MSYFFFFLLRNAYICPSLLDVELITKTKSEMIQDKKLLIHKFKIWRKLILRIVTYLLLWYDIPDPHLSVHVSLRELHLIV